MTNTEATAERVVVIVDPGYGDQLRDIWPGVAAWIVMSPANEPVVRSLWAAVPDADQLTGITGFRYDGNATSEACLLTELGTVDLHHGPYSSENPYTTLEAIGTPLTTKIRDALSELGFTNFAENAVGFVASRTQN
jgi:hypothetical protein